MKLLGNCVTTMLRAQESRRLFHHPFALILASIRLAQDTIRLSKESESELGASKPTLDLASCEREFRNRSCRGKGR
jgi:hypothetical protein